MAWWGSTYIGVIIHLVAALRNALCREICLLFQYRPADDLRATHEGARKPWENKKVVGGGCKEQNDSLQMPERVWNW